MLQWLEGLVGKQVRILVTEECRYHGQLGQVLPAKDGSVAALVLVNRSLTCAVPWSRVLRLDVIGPAEGENPDAEQA